MLGNWTKVRDLRALPQQTFREWWKLRTKLGSAGSGSAPLHAARKLAEDDNSDA
jgi:hypothetical protein